jgi:hypothetical protein
LPPDDEPDTEERCCYEAQQANLIWHCDLHDHVSLGERKKMITFIDDASRMIMGYRFIPNKTSYETALALEETVRQSGCIPYAIWTDKGGESAGLFDESRTMHNKTERSRGSGGRRTEFRLTGCRPEYKDIT